MVLCEREDVWGEFTRSTKRGVICPTLHKFGEPEIDYFNGRHIGWDEQKIVGFQIWTQPHWVTWSECMWMMWCDCVIPQCAMPFAWRYATAVKICRSIAAASLSEYGCFWICSNNSPPRQTSITMYNLNSSSKTLFNEIICLWFNLSIIDTSLRNWSYDSLGNAFFVIILTANSFLVDISTPKHALPKWPAFYHITHHISRSVHSRAVNECVRCVRCACPNTLPKVKNFRMSSVKPNTHSPFVGLDNIFTHTGNGMIDAIHVTTHQTTSQPNQPQRFNGRLILQLRRVWGVCLYV